MSRLQRPGAGAGASRLSTAVGIVISVTGVATGMMFGVSGLVFTSVLLVMAVFVVAVVTSPRRPGDGDGGPGERPAL